MQVQDPSGDPSLNSTLVRASLCCLPPVHVRACAAPTGIVPKKQACSPANSVVRFAVALAGRFRYYAGKTPSIRVQARAPPLLCPLSNRASQNTTDTYTQAVKTQSRSLILRRRSQALFMAA